MADGKGCKCAAYDESECACDADWTPQELIDARAEVARLRLTDAERQAVRFFSLIDGPGNVPVANKHADTLRGLLERLQMRIDPDTCRDADLLAAEVQRLRAVIASATPTLTDAERRDISIAADSYADNDDDADCGRIAATLRGLLERMK